MKKKIKSFNKFMNEDFVPGVGYSPKTVTRTEIQTDPVAGEDYIPGEDMEDDFDEYQPEREEIRPMTQRTNRMPLETEDEYYEEEEGGDELSSGWEGEAKIKKLFSLLGLPENTKLPVDYKGNTIDYFSETEKFHIGDMDFETAQDVKDFVDKSQDPIGRDYDNRSFSRQQVPMKQNRQAQVPMMEHNRRRRFN